MVYRVLIGVGAFLLGYYIGTQAERTAPIRKQLKQARQAQDKDIEAPVEKTE